ncbi:MAG: hypothetical protein R2874_02120 [Desulfobacterales bacterium]
MDRFLRHLENFREEWQVRQAKEEFLIHWIFSKSNDLFRTHRPTHPRKISESSRQYAQKQPAREASILEYGKPT